MFFLLFMIHINFRIMKHVTEAIMLSCTGNHENCQYMLLGNKLTILVDLLLCRLQVRVCHIIEFVSYLKSHVQSTAYGVKIILLNREACFFRLCEARPSLLLTSLSYSEAFYIKPRYIWNKSPGDVYKMMLLRMLQIYTKTLVLESLFQMNCRLKTEQFC